MNDPGAYGAVSVSPRGEVVAGSRITLRFTYTVGRRGLRRGGSLRIATPNDGWGEPLVPLHRYFQGGHERGGYDDGYCSYARRNVHCELSSETDAWIDLSAEERHCVAPLKGPWARHIVATVRDDDLREGDRITIVYGDRTWGEEGVEVQRVAPTDKDCFHAYVDVDASREFVELPADDLKQVRVVPGPTAQFGLVAPAIVRPGEEFALRLAAMDQFRNRPSDTFPGELRLGSEKPDVALGGSVRLQPENAGLKRVEGVSTRTEGTHRFTVEPAAGGRRTASNPVCCTDHSLRLYFGDLHCQTMWHSDSIGTPDEAYEYGRDVAGLDFMAVTDSGGCYGKGWIETQEATNRHYAPGRFVTLKGHEYGASVGHRNVVYRDCEVEAQLTDLPRNDPRALFAYYRSKHGEDGALIIPHHTKVWTQWDYHDPALEPIVEAYSCWGSGVEERDPLWHKSIRPGAGVFAGLKRGYRLGFIGSGDSHAGMPGRAYPADRQWCVEAKSGFACVYAQQLTREAVFDSLRRRRCYATTGVRLILEFSVDDTPMGGEAAAPAPDAPRCIRVHAIGTAKLSSLKVVKNNTNLAARSLDTWETFFEYHDTSTAQSGDFYFVKISQEDGNAAWSSPVWLRC